MATNSSIKINNIRWISSHGCTKNQTMNEVTDKITTVMTDDRNVKTKN